MARDAGRTGVKSSSRRLPSSDSRVITTSFLIANLHCPSCVSAIKEAVRSACGADILWVSPNIVTSVVTVQHTYAPSGVTDFIARMARSLGDAGFEISSVSTTAASVAAGSEDSPATSSRQSQVNVQHSSRGDGPLDRLLHLSGLAFSSSSSTAAESHNRRREAHLANCEQCRLSSNPTWSHSPKSPLLHSSSASHDEKIPIAVAPSAEPSLLNDTDGGLSPLKSVATDTGSSTAGPPSSGTPPTPRTWRVTLSIGGMTCTSCSRAIEDDFAQRSGILHATVNLVNNSATVDITDEITADSLVRAVEDLGFEAVLEDCVELDGERPKTTPPKEKKEPTRWRCLIAVGGMTCSSCTNSIHAELSKRDWITNVAVNLVSNSAIVEYTIEGKETEIAKTIEDVGFDATVSSVEKLESDHSETAAAVAQERVVQISVDGLFCRHCPGRLVHSLAAFKPKLEILSEPTIENPKVKIKYIPDTPTFTIRRILSAIEATDPAFRASVYHPPTLEERSKAVTARYQRQLLVRVIFSLIVAIPTFIIGIVYMSLLPNSNSGKQYLMAPWVSGISRIQIALFILATPVYFFGADVFHIRAAKEVFNLWRPGSRTPILRRFYKFGSMNLLISLGTTVAYISSVGQMISAAVHQPDMAADAHFHFDSVVFLALFLLLGRLIEAYSKAKTSDAVEMLGKLRPSTAILVERDDASGQTSDSVVAVDLVEFGDTIRVPHGASPAADGVVLQGETVLDESSLTGESRPIKKCPGDDLFAGTVNKGAAVLMRVTGAAGRSMLDQIVHVVREGQTKRAPIERVADMLTAYFVPIITLFAISTWVVWTVLAHVDGALPDHYIDAESGRVAFALQFAIAVFVVACPCGLGLAAPTAIFVGGGLAAKYGILAKGGGEAFEKASKIDVVVFDKTGTLTEGGDPKITDVITCPEALEGLEPSTQSGRQRSTSFLAVLKEIEGNSSHPIAKAIVSYCTAEIEQAQQEKPQQSEGQVVQVDEVPGKGMKATWERNAPDASSTSSGSSDVIVGNESLMRDHSVTIPEHVATQLEQWKREAKSVALAAIRHTIPEDNGSSSETPATEEDRRHYGPWQLAAALSISDPIRPEAQTIVRTLRDGGTRVWMLSGDNAVTARAVASQVGIDPSNVLAEVLPSQKAEKITYLQATLKAKGKGGKDEGGREDKARRATVAMVGDGINDAPALTRADVGVAIGSGSDVAISSADFVLVASSLGTVVTLLELSRAVFRRIRVNFAWAVVYNMIALPVAAGCLYPLRTPSGDHIRLDPVWAALAMALSSISVVLSSLALRLRVPWIGFRRSSA